MKVFVIMGNDFPECVFMDRTKAEEYCEERKKVDKARRDLEGDSRPGIYWRSYELELR